MRWAGHVAHKGEMRNAYKVGIPEEKRQNARVRRILDDNIKTDVT
jgi:hypothetical protein